MLKYTLRENYIISFYIDGVHPCKSSIIILDWNFGIDKDLYINVV
jgi:hypothetical protein